MKGTYKRSKKKSRVGVLFSGLSTLREAGIRIVTQLSPFLSHRHSFVTPTYGGHRDSGHSFRGGAPLAYRDSDIELLVNLREGPEGLSFLLRINLVKENLSKQLKLWGLLRHLLNIESSPEKHKNFLNRFIPIWYLTGDIWKGDVETTLDSERNYAPAHTLTLDGAVKCLEGWLPPCNLPDLPPTAMTSRDDGG
ncbi:hypothetical protein JHK82_020371 [Glycine max]|nr:hypothetical protein JHK85_020825 [Glycine max]KAG5135640.1 hypothetical protein JHK82_020371 [Glycine max]